jgi:hypothetical protein
MLFINKAQNQKGAKQRAQYEKGASCGAGFPQASAFAFNKLNV